MKNNSKKHGGFTLIEIIISMTLLAIISIGVYKGYLLLIKHTKEGEVKQTAALIGKKTVEEIKSIKVFNGTLNLDGKPITLSEEAITKSYTKFLHLDAKYKICDDQTNDDYIYIEEITLTPTENSEGETITVDKNNISNNIGNNNILEDTFYLGKDKSSGDYISRDNISKNNVEIQDGKIRIYMYIQTQKYENENKKVLSVRNSKGKNLLDDKELGIVLDKSNNKKNEVNIYMNFNKYIKEPGKDLESVEVYVSNKNEEENSETNIYLQKSSDVNVNVTFNEGEGYIYNDRAQDYENNKIGPLYDVEVKIKKKGSEDFLFTGYSTQNINVN